MNEIHMLVVRQRNGPGYDAKGCHGPRRYARVTEISVVKYTAAIHEAARRGVLERAGIRRVPL